MTDYRFPRAAMCLRDRPAHSRHLDGATRGGSITRTGFGFTLLAAGICLSPALHAQSTTFNGTVALSSQLVDRGQAITGNTPIVQGAASWTFPAGWSVGLSGAAVVRSPSRLAEALVQASRHWSLSDDWQMQASLLYYRYSTGNRSGTSDRTETGLNWTYRDVLTMGLSAIYVLGAEGHRPRGAADLSLHWPLAEHVSVSAGAGVAQSLAAPYRPYRYGHSWPYRHDSTGLSRYGHVGLLWAKGPWRIELDRIMADPATRRQRDYLGASPWVATISRSF